MEWANVNHCSTWCTAVQTSAHNFFPSVEITLPGPHLQTWVCHGMARCTSLQHFLKDRKEQCCMNAADAVPGLKSMHICEPSRKKLMLREDKQLNHHYSTYTPSGWGGPASCLSVYSPYVFPNYSHIVAETELSLLKSGRSLYPLWLCCTWTQSLVSPTQSGVLSFAS